MDNDDASEISLAKIWTRELNARRCDLIEQELRGTLTADEMAELEDLQVRLRRYRRLVTPLPLDETRLILQELERKATEAKP